MEKRRVAKGIRGINEILRNDRPGWHVMVDSLGDGEYFYFDFLMMTIEDITDLPRYSDHYLTGTMGNNVYFSMKAKAI